MDKIKPWQAALVAIIAVAIAISVIWHGTVGQSPPPMPAAFTGPAHMPGAPAPGSPASGSGTVNR